jgi:hypothetical protein
MTQPNNVIGYISKRLSEFFILTNNPYMGATDFNREHPLLKEFSRKDKKNGKILTFKIHEIIKNEIEKEFSLYPFKKGKLEIDLGDKNQHIAYEILLGNGDEIWKDILKAILVEADKLVVFCRNYPDKDMRGYREIRNAISNLEPFLKEKLTIQLALIEPR